MRSKAHIVFLYVLIFTLSITASAFSQSFSFYDTILEKGLSIYLLENNFEQKQQVSCPVGSRVLVTSTTAQQQQVYLYKNEKGQVWDIGLPIDSSFYQLGDLLQSASIEEKIISSALWYINEADRDLLIHWITTNQITIREALENESASAADLLLSLRSEGTHFLLKEMGSSDRNKSLYLIFSQSKNEEIRIEFPLSIDVAMRGYSTIYANYLFGSTANDSLIFWTSCQPIQVGCGETKTDSLAKLAASPEDAFLVLQKSILTKLLPDWERILPQINEVRLMNWDELEMKFGQKITQSRFIAYWQHLLVNNSFCDAQFVLNEDGEQYIIKWHQPIKRTQSMLYFDRIGGGYRLSFIY